MAKEEQYLNSLPDPAMLAGFIIRSLDTMRQEYPTAYFLLCGTLAPREVLLIFDDEFVALHFTPGEVRWLPQTANPTVRLRTTRQSILDVIDGRLTLHQAIESDVITLWGSVDDLALFHEGLLTYIRGAIRCPTFPNLLDRFRLAVAPVTS